jgi:hypothetical protein
VEVGVGVLLNDEVIDGVIEALIVVDGVIVDVEEIVLSEVPVIVPEGVDETLAVVVPVIVSVFDGVFNAVPVPVIDGVYVEVIVTEGVFVT